MSAPKSFIGHKMQWLLDAASTPGITVRALGAAITCAEGAWPPDAEVRPTQSEMAASIGKPQSALSTGCRELLELGLLRVRVNGNRRHYSLDFDRLNRSTPPKRAAKGKLRQSAATDIALPSVADSDLSAPPDIANTLGNIRSDGSTISAATVEHYSLIPLEGDDLLPSPLTEDVEESISQSLAGAPDGARPCRLETEVEAIFGRPLRYDQLMQFRKLFSTLGSDDLAQRLVNYREGVEAGTIASIPISKWLRQGGLVGVQNVA